MNSRVDILVVDDALAVRSRLVALFADVPGVGSILQAEGVRQAQELFQRHHPDVVVLDLNLRGESGLSLLHYFKRSRQDTLVIVLTNHSDSHHEKSCRRLGADHFFDKSTQFEAVLPVLAHQALQLNCSQ